jgi:hypothetical protein
MTLLKVRNGTADSGRWVQVQNDLRETLKFSIHKSCCKLEYLFVLTFSGITKMNLKSKLTFALRCESNFKGLMYCFNK